MDVKHDEKLTLGDDGIFLPQFETNDREAPFETQYSGADDIVAMGTIANDTIEYAGTRTSNNFQQIKKKTTINDVDDD